jgi:nucleoside-diphosphate-sugar epimerase
MTGRFFLFGAGYSARFFARSLAGKAGFLGGTTRSRDRFPSLEQAGIEPFLFDGGTPSPGIVEALRSVTHLVVSAAPGEAGDPVLAAARGTILSGMPALRWVGYLSTVGVYGNHDGAWVDEESACRPASPRNVARVAAEKEWLALARESGIPVAVLRLAGIYGPGRNTFVNLKNGTAHRIVKPGQVFNRIHVEDIAGVLHRLSAAAEGGIFNVADDEPAPPQEVVAFAAALMGVAPPPEIPFEKAEMTPMARSFYGDNKRVSNARIRAHGYRFLYPDYRDAFTRMWREGSWR